jgi:hypothetical protein
MDKEARESNLAKSGLWNAVIYRRFASVEIRGK